MKYIYLIFVASLFASCNRSQGDVEISGTAKGINFGHVMVRDPANNTIIKTDIDGGKFNTGKYFLQYPGYFKLMYSSGSTATRKIDIYLEPGSYTIAIDQQKINDYPHITSSSKIQNELSAYNVMVDSAANAVHQKVVAINAQLNGPENKVYMPGEYTALANKLLADEQKANRIDLLNVLTAFINKYPESVAAAHIMLQMDYQNNPVEYYKIYQKLSPDAKNSDDGKELGAKLQELAKLAPGASVPIAGTTPDGKGLNIKAINKKVILLDLWRSSNGSSRDNHGQLISALLPKFGSKGFGVISVSLDTEKDKWLAAIQSDKMDWPQLSDLKGDDSPNAAAWGIKSIPTYYLLDGEGHIIKRVTEFNDVAAAVNDYLKNH